MSAERIARSLLIVLAVFRFVDLFCCEAIGQTVIEINDGETLKFADLLAGSFQGAEFELGPNTHFEINDGGRLGDRTENLNLGTFDFAGSTIDVREGGIYSHCTSIGCGIASNLILNVNGGSLSSDFRPGVGSIANINSGFAGRLLPEPGSLVNIYGNPTTPTFFNPTTTTFFSFLGASQGSTANIAGGRFTAIDVPDGSDVTLIGGEFRLNGSDYNEQTISLVPGDTFSGTLSDGSIFIITPATNLSHSNIKLDTAPLPEITMSEIIIDGTEQASLRDYRNGQILTVRDGGMLGTLNFPSRIYVQRSTLNIEGGVFGQSSRVIESQVTVSGGEVGNRFETYFGTKVKVTGGNFRGDAWARAGSVWEIYDGNIGSNYIAWGGSEVNIFGGDVGYVFTSLPGSIVNIHGGSFEDLMTIEGTVNLFVKSASLNGTPIDLEFGETVEITERGFSSILDVVLSDGTPLSIPLNTFPRGGEAPIGFVHADADLSVVLVVPEPQTIHLVAFCIAALICQSRKRKHQDFF